MSPTPFTRPWQVIWLCMALDEELSSLVSQLTSSLRVAGGLSAVTCSWVMHIWLVKGWPGMGMPLAFIIAMASGGMSGIFGMFGVSMVEVTVHRPALPWAAMAATGIRIRAVPIRAEIRERLMLLSLWPQGKCDQAAGRRQIMVRSEER